MMRRCQAYSCLMAAFFWVLESSERLESNFGCQLDGYFSDTATWDTPEKIQLFSLLQSNFFANFKAVFQFGGLLRAQI